MAPHFWAEIERLLRQKAPITIGNAEAPTVLFMGDIIPKRFPLARLMMERAEKKRARDVEKWTRESHAKEYLTTDQHIVDEFGEWEAAALPWRRALQVIGHEYGLLDVDGNPKNQWAAKIVEQGRKVHRRAHRETLEDERYRKALIAKGVLSASMTKTTFAGTQREPEHKPPRLVPSRDLWGVVGRPSLLSQPRSQPNDIIGLASGWEFGEQNNQPLPSGCIVGS